VRDRELRHQERAAQADRDLPVEQVDRHLLDVAPVQALRGRGDVHEDVQPAAPGRGGLHDPAGVLVDGDVAEDTGGFPASAGDLVGHRVKAAPAIVRQAEDLLAAVRHAGSLPV